MVLLGLLLVGGGAYATVRSDTGEFLLGAVGVWLAVGCLLGLVFGGPVLLEGAGVPIPGIRMTGLGLATLSVVVAAAACWVSADPFDYCGAVSEHVLGLGGWLILTARDVAKLLLGLVFTTLTIVYGGAVGAAVFYSADGLLPATGLERGEMIDAVLWPINWSLLAVVILVPVLVVLTNAAAYAEAGRIAAQRRREAAGTQPW